MPSTGFNIATYVKYLKLEKNELKNFLIASIVLAFIISFTQWGEGNVARIEVGLLNFLVSFIISSTILGIFMFTSKIVALTRGYTANIVLSYPMILVSILVTFVSYGAFWFFPILGINLEHQKKLRLGMFRYELNLKEISLVAFSGPLGVLFMSFFLKLFIQFLNFDAFWFTQAIKVAAAFSLFVMLPFPKTNGMLIFFDSREKYFMYLGVIVGFALSIFFIDNLLLILLSAILFSALFFYFGLKILEKIS